MVLDLTPFLELVKRRCGLSFEDDRQRLLEQALRQRMAETGARSAPHYLARLMAGDHEFNDLVSLLTVNETYFFREPRQLTLLAERLAPRLLARPDGTLPVRILSAGCSTGEETYSIALTLRERYGDAVTGLFQVTGCDIDRRALTKARAGRYSDFSFRGVRPDLKERYFLAADDTLFTLPQALRESVGFTPMNLLDEPPPGIVGPYDVIFLRNVTIYFDTPTRRAIQSRMRTLLRPDGYLLVGMAETLANDFGLMALVQEDGLFYFAREAAAVPEPPAPLHPAARPGPEPEPEPPPSPLPPLRPSPPSPTPSPSPLLLPAHATTFDDALRLTWERSYDLALAVLASLGPEPVPVPKPDSQPETPPDSMDIRPLVLKAHILLNRKELAAAEAAARRALEFEPWSIDAILVLGLAARHAGQAGEALAWFKRATYASHGCWPAHYYLADHYRLAGDRQQARSAYRVALALLSSVTGVDSGLKVLLPAFPASDIRFLCEHQLTLMEGKPPSPSGLRSRS